MVKKEKKDARKLQRDQQWVEVVAQLLWRIPSRSHNCWLVGASTSSISSPRFLGYRDIMFLRPIHKSCIEQSSWQSKKTRSVCKDCPIMGSGDKQHVVG
jgi:hypothetical protein